MKKNKIVRWSIKWSAISLMAAIGTLLSFHTELLSPTFIKRGITYPYRTEITEMDWYQPLEKVSGSFRIENDLAQATQSKIPQDTLAEVEKYAFDRNTKALLVVHHGKIVLEKYAQGFSKNSYTNSMSMAKTILALLVGSAIQERKIGSVEDPITDYLPEGPLKLSQSQNRNRAIQIRHLLQMSSGLRFNDSTTNPFSELIQIHLGTDILSIMKGLSAKQDPETAFQYNNGNTQLMSLILERATGLRYSEYLSQKLWRPLGNSDAYLWLDREGGTAKTYCCLFSTARDWARIGLMLMNRGRIGETAIVPETWIKSMLTPSPLEPEYGYFTWLGGSQGAYKSSKNARTESFIASDLFYAEGRGRQFVYVIPSKDLVIVRLGESPWALKPPVEWDDAYIPNALVRAL